MYLDRGGPSESVYALAELWSASNAQQPEIVPSASFLTPIVDSQVTFHKSLYRSNGDYTSAKALVLSSDQPGVSTRGAIYRSV